MGSFVTQKPHVVCIPLPAQGHVNSMMQLAKLLHSRGFHITFVNTEFNHRRLLRAKVCSAVQKNCLAPLCDLLTKLNSSPNIPQGSCIVSDGAMSFAIQAGMELGIPEVQFWTASACGFMGYFHYQELIQRGIVPLKEEFIEVTKGRGLLVNWCPQDKVLLHSSIRGFLTHCGWNSILESISGGVPMLCRPFFAQQQTNFLYACTTWGIGLEINNDVKRE
ncbi:hypothetical protein NE237_016164 [Protea cynaroides]|uniref:Glycosyltransferase N-terminal domain-containing protein n=1 Tax=Protea cynaroides TaxID=273540 RepID=A0A9Q0QRS3_9MAGN|nr:hypothetical protein NE237_016164 [Protea cynaroides]